LLYGIVLGLVAFPVSAAVYTTTGTITVLRAVSDQANGNAPSVREVMGIQISPIPAAGCIWLWLQPTSKNTMATLLAAKSTGATVSVVYESTATPPWGDPNACGLLSIDFL